MSCRPTTDSDAGSTSASATVTTTPDAEDIRTCRYPLGYGRLVDDVTATALREMVDLTDDFPDQFKPEFEPGYWARVQDGAERWYVQFEGDISDNEFTVLGHTAADAVRTAAREAQSRVS